MSLILVSGLCRSGTSLMMQMLAAGGWPVYDLAAALRERGPEAEAELTASLVGHPMGDLHTFAGFDQIRAWEEAYLPPDELGKYADSVGHQPTRRV